MNATPNVFIMSSNPALKLAEALAQVLSRGGRMDVRTWSGGEFRAGDPFIDTLQRTLIQYDFGISILTPDDPTKVRNQQAIEPRDNVSFELGLFLGARGRQRAFPIAVSVAGIRPSLASDTHGMSHFSLEVADLNRPVPSLVAEIEREAEAIAAQILVRYAIPTITLLPSTGLAIGYFHNFILPVMRGLRANQQVNVTVAGARVQRPVNIGTAVLTVCIPDNLRDATRDNWGIKANALGLVQGEVDPTDDPELPRAYPFRLNASVEAGRIEIFDTPTTLMTAQHVVRRLLPEPNYHRGDREMAEGREIQNFQQAIRFLLDEPDNSWFSERIHFRRWGDL